MAVLLEKFHFDVTVHPAPSKEKKKAIVWGRYRARGIGKGDIVHKCRGLKRAQPFQSPSGSFGLPVIVTYSPLTQSTLMQSCLEHCVGS